MCCHCSLFSRMLCVVCVVCPLHKLDRECSPRSRQVSECFACHCEHDRITVRSGLLEQDAEGVRELKGREKERSEGEEEKEGK